MEVSKAQQVPSQRPKPTLHQTVWRRMLRRRQPGACWTLLYRVCTEAGLSAWRLGTGAEPRSETVKPMVRCHVIAADLVRSLCC
jgi:hypothetical protein